MTHRDGIVATIALALSTLAMALVVASGAYGQAAGREAHGMQALAHALAHTVSADHAANAQWLAAAPQEAE